jgi:hypothetical protein
MPTLPADCELALTVAGDDGAAVPFGHGGWATVVVARAGTFAPQVCVRRKGQPSKAAICDWRLPAVAVANPGFEVVVEPTPEQRQALDDAVARARAR